MAVDHEEFHHPTPLQTHITTVWRWRRRLPLRWRKVQTVWLGGRRPGRRLLLAKMLRKMRLKWLKLKYPSMLRKLKEYYRNVVKDVIEAGASIETLQQRLSIESAYAIPIGFTFSSYPPRRLAAHRSEATFV